MTGTASDERLPARAGSWRFQSSLRRAAGVGGGLGLAAAHVGTVSPRLGRQRLLYLPIGGSVRDERDQLWIAKFPSRNDEDDMGAWERGVHDLAGRAGVVVPEVQLRRFGSSTRGVRSGAVSCFPSAYRTRMTTCAIMGGQGRARRGVLHISQSVHAARSVQ